MKNMDIRIAIANKRLKYYEVAEACGISECTFSRWMRSEMSPERKKKVQKAIEDITKELYA